MNRSRGQPDPEISDAFIDRVCRSLVADRLVRRRLPVWGRIHIDRRQPFLCIYRRPFDRQDAGTERLLLGQAAYLFATGEPDAHAAVSRLVSRLAGTLSRSFGAAMVLELWSVPPRDASTATAPDYAPNLGIVAPAHEVPIETLESLERALLATDWPTRAPKISIEYRADAAPPGLPPILTEPEARGLNVTLLGLELESMYRDAADDEVLPAVLAGTQHALGHALKQAFYTFSHTRASYRPAHYHELGRRALTNAVRETDRRLAEVADSFDPILHATPVNSEAAWSRFRATDFQRAPEFHYRPLRVDPAALKYELFRIPLERIEDPTLHGLFAEKRDEMDRQITMLGDRGTPSYLLGSQQVFGAVDEDLIGLARDVLTALPPASSNADPGATLDAAGLASLANRELDHYRAVYPELPADVEVRSDVPGVMVSRGHLLIGTDVAVSADRANATLQHEVGTHIVTYYNGLEQPFQQFHAGLPGYEELQEGIAVLAEYLVGGLGPHRMRVLAARVIAVRCLTDGADFVDTFRVLHDDFGFDGKSAYTIAMRVHRGGGLTKDLVYLRGLARVLAFVASDGSLEELLLGKFGLHHVSLVEELKWRKILRPAKLRARYLDQPEAVARLDRLRRGVTVSELAAESSP